jgi:hypothetical protein
VVAAILISFKISLQEIGEEENFKDHEHDEQLNEDNQPYLFPPPRKVCKPLPVKPESTFQYIHILAYKNGLIS